MYERILKHFIYHVFRVSLDYKKKRKYEKIDLFFYYSEKYFYRLKYKEMIKIVNNALKKYYFKLNTRQNNKKINSFFFSFISCSIQPNRK